MRVFIEKIDGYLGWSKSQYSIKRDHIAGRTDFFQRREWVVKMKSQSAISSKKWNERLGAFRYNFNKAL